MEYVYAAMLIHKAGRKVDEATVKKVLEAAGVKPDDTRVKALVASLEGVNIDETVKKAETMPMAAPTTAPAQSSETKAEKKEEKKSEEEEKKSEEAAAAGLSALFG